MDVGQHFLLMKIAKMRNHSLQTLHWQAKVEERPRRLNELLQNNNVA